MSAKKGIDAAAALLRKHREIILYLVFGVLTTLVSAVFYFLSSWGLGLSAWLSTVVSWIFAVIFAFFTNKLYVFQSKDISKTRTIKEATWFFIMRLVSLALNVAIMFVFVDWLDLHEPTLFVIAQIIVVVFNYVASKIWIFRK
ncbi:MAG: GtrA family protein [Defluviitaleaceae bacterium]|nr:GtrA family protein [Defluviitaleaceae bacterium]